MPKLKRALGLFETTLVGVGIILGAGIYVLIGEVAALAGNAAWLSFALVAVLCAFTGMSYAKLAALFPKAGAEYVYVKHAFGKELAWLVGWFLIVGCIVGTATVAIGFANYFAAMFNTPVVLTALTLVVICCFILLLGVKESAIVEIAMTFVETLGLIAIILIGIPRLGSVNYFELANAGVVGVFQGATLAFFAYIGFESIARLAEETKNPKRNIPRAILLSIAITATLYVLVAFSAISTLGWRELAKSKAPLASVAAKAFGDVAFKALSIIALFSTANTVLAVMLTTIRLIYGMASQFALPKFLAFVSRGSRVPWTATLATTLATMAFILIKEIAVVANMTNFLVISTFALVNASLLVIQKRKTKKWLCRSNLIPLLGIITCLFMLLHVTAQAFCFGIALLVFGFVLHRILKRFKIVRI